MKTQVQGRWTPPVLLTSLPPPTRSSNSGRWLVKQGRDLSVPMYIYGHDNFPMVDATWDPYYSRNVVELINPRGLLPLLFPGTSYRSVAAMKLPEGSLVKVTIPREYTRGGRTEVKGYNVSLLTAWGLQLFLQRARVFCGGGDSSTATDADAVRARASAMSVMEQLNAYCREWDSRNALFLRNLGAPSPEKNNLPTRRELEISLVATRTSLLAEVGLCTLNSVDP
jgi:hypothetical protein